MRNNKFKDLSKHETNALLHIPMREQNERLVWVDSALSLVLEHEAAKVVLSKKGQTPDEKRSLRHCAVLAAGMVEAKILQPEDAVDYTIFRYKRDQKTQRDLSGLYTKESVRVSEIAALIGKTSRTVQFHIKGKLLPKLTQQHPHAEIKRSDLLKWLSQSPSYKGIYQEFKMIEHQRAIDARLRKDK